MALGELSCTQYLKTEAKPVGDTLNAFAFIFFKQSQKPDNLVLSNSALCLSLGSSSVAG